MFLPVFLSGILLTPAHAQRSLAGEAELRQKLARLGTVGGVMMIGAHPDDENTALLAYFSRGRHMRTAYLSLTRGEGGQNLIGSEQGDALGVIRTQELLAARRIDGGEQFFTRAIDFGFSKTAAEALSKWPRDKVLGDIVYGIRRFRPDVIVLRFSGTPRDGHGQHQVSAILGREAFSAAADPTRYPEQLQWVEAWQPKRLMYNVISFTADQEREAQKLDARIEIDLGEYSPELGYSYGEIAGMSRSQHRSQGMGAPEQKGSMRNYLVTIAGDVAKKDAFEGIDTTWARVPGGAPIQESLDRIAADYKPAHPEDLVRPLMEVRPRMAAIANPIAEEKLHELVETVASAAALSVEAFADRFAVTPGANVKVTLSALLRVPAQVTLTGIRLTGMQDAPTLSVARAVLTANQTSQYSATVHVPDNEPYSQPYWLVEPPDGAMYTVRDARMIGLAENPPVLEARFSIRVAGADLEIVRPVQYRYIDHVYGELARPLAVVPPAAVSFSERALVFATAASRRIDVPVKATTGRIAGDVHLEAPEGWRVEPPAQHFELSAPGQETTAAFDVTPPSSDSQALLRAVAMVGDRRITVGMQVIDYPHIPAQTLFPRAETKVVRGDVRNLSKNVGYIMGAGDEVPASLRQIGVEVTLLSPTDLSRGNLSRFDAIITGVRAFNVRPDLRANYQRLFDYAAQGGTVIVQYNVLEGGPFGGDPSLLEHIGPLPITISRDRVTVEEAPVAFPNPANPLLHAPNEITARDFDGWVQERGLYFASEWDLKYQSVLESHDPGEEPHPGGELYLRYGKGVYVFSAYAWFRQLPAGVPGAYRLFTNMLSAGKTQ
jgi:LmbE family N-acetylglucosaminyl deacetylase